MSKEIKVNVLFKDNINALMGRLNKLETTLNKIQSVKLNAALKIDTKQLTNAKRSVQGLVNQLKNLEKTYTVKIKVEGLDKVKSEINKIKSQLKNLEKGTEAKVATSGKTRQPSLTTSLSGALRLSRELYKTEAARQRLEAAKSKAESVINMSNLKTERERVRLSTEISKVETLRIKNETLQKLNALKIEKETQRTLTAQEQREIAILKRLQEQVNLKHKSFNASLAELRLRQKEETYDDVVKKTKATAEYAALRAASFKKQAPIIEETKKWQKQAAEYRTKLVQSRAWLQEQINPIIIQKGLLDIENKKKALLNKELSAKSKEQVMSLRQRREEERKAKEEQKKALAEQKRIEQEQLEALAKRKAIFDRISKVTGFVGDNVLKASKFLAIEYPQMVANYGIKYYTAIGNVVGGVFKKVFDVTGTMTSMFTQQVIPTFLNLGKVAVGTVGGIAKGFLSSFVGLFELPYKSFRMLERVFDYTDRMFRHFSQAFYYVGATLSNYSRTFLGAALTLAAGFSRIIRGLFENLKTQYALTVTAGIITEPAEALKLKTTEDYQKNIYGKLTELTKVAYRINQTTGLGFEQAADLLYFIASSGFQGKELETISENIAKVAFATSVEPVELFRSMIAITGAYNIPETPENLNNVLAKLSIAVARGVFTMGEFATQIQRVSAFAEASNTSLEETLAIMVGMSRAGLKPELIGTGLSQLFMQFTRPETMEKLIKYGMPLTLFRGGEFVTPSVYEIIKTLATKYGTENMFFWRGFSRELKLEKRAQTALYTIVNSLSKIDETLNELSNNASAEAYLNAIIRGIPEAMAKRYAEIKGSIDKIYTSFLNGLSKLFAGTLDLTGVSEQTAKNIAGFKNIFERVHNILNAIANGMDDGKIFIYILDALINIAKLIWNLLKVAMVLGVLGLLYRTFAALFELLRPATLLLLGFINGLIEALGGAEGLDEGVKAYVKAVMAVGEAFGKAVGKFFKIFVNAEQFTGTENKPINLVYTVNIMFGDVAKAVQEFVNNIIAELDKHKQRLSGYVAEIMLSTLSMGMNVGRLILSLVDTFSLAFRKAGFIALFITKNIDDVKNKKKTTQQIAQELKAEYLKQFGEPIDVDESIIKTWVDSFVSFYNALYTSVAEAVKNFGIGGIDWVNVALTFTTQFFRGLNAGLEALVGYFKSADGKEKLKEFEQSISEFTTEAIRLVANGLRLFLIFLPNIIGGIAEGIKNANMPKIFKGLEKEWEAVKNSLNENLPTIWSAFLDIMIFGLDKYDDVLDAFGKSVARHADKLVELFRGIGRILLSQTVIASEFFLGASEGLAAIVGEIVKGTGEAAAEWQTIRKNLTNAFKTIFEQTYDWLTLGAELASSILEGIAQGLEKANNDSTQKERFRKALGDMIVSGLKTAIQGAEFLSSIGVELARGIAAAMIMLDKMWKNELKAGETITIDEAFKYKVTENDLKALQNTVENAKTTFKTFLSILPIGVDWATSFIAGTLNQTSSLLDDVIKYQKWVTLDKKDPKKKPKLMFDEKNIESIFKNFESIIVSIGKILSDMALITLNVFIKEIVLSGWDTSQEATLKQRMNELLRAVWIAIFGSMLFSAATGFNPITTITLGIIVAVALEGIKWTFDIIKELEKIGPKPDKFQVPTFLQTVSDKNYQPKTNLKTFEANKSAFVSNLARQMTEAEYKKLVGVSSAIKPQLIQHMLGMVSSLTTGGSYKNLVAYQTELNAAFDIAKKTIDQYLNPHIGKDAKSWTAAELKTATDAFKSLGSEISWYVKAMLTDVALYQPDYFDDVVKMVGDWLKVLYDTRITFAPEELIDAWFEGLKGLGELSTKKIGFASGGHTGVGYKYDVAGIVHKGEYVIPKWMVQKYPEVIAQLEGIRLRGYANGTDIQIPPLTGNISETITYLKDIKDKLIGLSSKTAEMLNKGETFDKIIANTSGETVDILFELLNTIQPLTKELISAAEGIITALEGFEGNIKNIESELTTIKAKTGETEASAEQTVVKEKGSLLEAILGLLTGVNTPSGFANTYMNIPGLKEISGFLLKIASVVPGGMMMATGAIDTSQIKEKDLFVQSVETLGAAFSWLFGILGPVGDIVKGTISQLGGVIGAFDSVQKVLDPVKTVLQVVAQVLQPVVDQAMQPFIDLLTQIGQIIGYALAPFLQVIGIILQTLLLPILSPLVDTLRFFGKILYIVGGIFKMVTVWIYNAVANMFNWIADIVNNTLGRLLGIQMSKMQLMENVTFDQIIKEAENLFGTSTAGSSTSGGVGVTSKAENINYTVYATVEFQDMVIADKEELKKLILDALKELDIQLGQ